MKLPLALGLISMIICHQSVPAVGGKYGEAYIESVLYIKMRRPIQNLMPQINKDKNKT